MPRPVRRLPRAALAAMAAVLAAVLVLAGCGAIPTSGPVGSIAPGDGSSGSGIYIFNPPGPGSGATPEEIIEGFYRAGIAPADDYRIAREYLAPAFAGEWRPVEQTLVYDAEPSIVDNVQEGSYTVQVEAAAVIDEHGLRTDLPANSTRSVDVHLEQVDGEWRITDAPDGTLVETGNFSVLFAPHLLYFYDATYSYAIPDVRWFAFRQGLAATMVESLLAGPAPYLRNAAFSAFPEDAALTRPAVPIDAGKATVDLVESVFIDASDTRRQQMQQQLELTLGRLNNVTSVTMTVNQREVGLGAEAPGFTAAILDPAVADTQIALAGGALVYYQGDGIVPVGGVPDISGYKPRDPAMGPSGNLYAFLDGERTRLFTVDETGRVSAAVRGMDLVAPSIDTYGWTWTVTGGSHPHVMAVPASTTLDGPARQVAADWLGDAQVHSLRVSRDGARVAVVARIGGEDALYIGGIVRDSDGVPRGLTEPLKVPTAVPVSRAVWDSDISVIVMRANAEEAVTAERVGLDGSSELFLPLHGMIGLSAGPGERRPVYAETPDGIYSRVGNSWSAQGRQASNLSYPG
ncbi:lipoprotein LpqB [Zafaria cholistanensis]|uniref:Lipoprotein LpqB n=1 Tax=Zafaria cholistanensis TaxID=1682741 RepID=A0A5A7NUE8_9MICC|nr:LpqB family beta-propeller domain-containing protein [Zafaria cholistanensis]GER24349.1 lipoprotein LpqB [Zafaria cholistanensis]